jgi:hypothetical protein
MKRHIAGILAVFLLASLSCMSQQDAPPERLVPTPARTALGLALGGTFSMHGGGLQFPRESPPVILYDEASGLGPSFGIRAQLPLTATLSFSPRLFAECRGGSFTSEPFVMEIIGKDMRPQDMRLEDELEVVLRLGGLDLLLTWAPLDNGLYFAAGPSMALRLYEEFRVTGRILSPAGVTFLDGTTEKEMYDDDPGLTRSLHIGLRAGAGYQLALNQDLALGLETLYLYPLQSVTEDDDWSLQGLQATLTLLFLL